MTDEELKVELVELRGQVKTLEQKLLVSEKHRELTRLSLLGRCHELGAQIAELQAHLTKRNATIGRLRTALRELKKGTSE